MPKRAAISIILSVTALLVSSLNAFAAEAIDIETGHHSARELQEKVELEQLLAVRFSRTVRKLCDVRKKLTENWPQTSDF